MTDAGRDDQDLAEALDASKLSTDPLDQEVEDYPPDELQGADEYGTVPQEERVDEPIDERDRRYEPDPLVEELDRQEDA